MIKVVNNAIKIIFYIQDNATIKLEDVWNIITVLFVKLAKMIMFL